MKEDQHQTPFYTQLWFMIFTLILCAPVGIYLIYTYSDWRPNTKILISIVCFAFFMIVVKFALYGIVGNANQAERVDSIRSAEIQKRASSNSASSSSKVTTKESTSTVADSVDSSSNTSNTGSATSAQDDTQGRTTTSDEEASAKAKETLLSLYNQLNSNYNEMKNSYDKQTWENFTALWTSQLQTVKSTLPTSDTTTNTMVLDLYNIYQIIDRSFKNQAQANDIQTWVSLDKELNTYFHS